MAALRIRLLGGFSLEHENRTLPPLPSRAARSLLALLVTQRGTTQSRDFLAGTFWPDLPEARARRRLSHALWQLQQVLAEVAGSEPFVMVEADTVRFNNQADYWLDVDEFEGLGAGSLAEMEAAIDLYRGDFLAGSYDDWLLVEQQRLRGEYAALLQRAIDGHKGLGAISKGLAFARRLVAHEPLNEEAHREVMRLSFLLGQFNDAIQQFEFCSSILEEELGDHPSAATQALYAEIVMQRAKGDRPFVPHPQSILFQPGEPAMVGRVEERAAVVERMAGLFAGRGGIVLVEGSSGVGVSRFLGLLAEDAHWRGLGVMEATARGAGLPYDLCRQSLGDALSPLRAQQVTAVVEPVWLSAASAVLPRLKPPGEAVTRLQPGEEAEQVVQGLAEVLLAFGRISPHVVLFDDVHLADAESLAFLRLAAHRLRSSNVLLVLGYHSAEARDDLKVWETLLALDAQPGVSRLMLQELDATETAELFRMATGSPPDAALVESVFSQTGGNPLLVLESLRGMTQQAELGEMAPLTEVATDLLERRLRAAPPSTLRALQAASMFDTPVTVESVAVVAQLSRDEALSALDDALRRALLVERDDQVEFGHAQMRTATYGTLSESASISMHREAATWIQRSHPDRYEELARHLQRSGQLARAAEYLDRAAQQASSVFAYDTAARHLAASLDVALQAGVADSALITTLLRYEQLLDQLSRHAEQGSVLARLQAAVTKPPERLEVERRRILYLANVDEYDAAEKAAAQAMLFAQQEDLPSGGTLAARGLALSWSGRPSDAMPYLQSAADSAEMETAEVAEVRYALGMAMSSLDHPQADTELERALVLFTEANLRRRVADVLGLMATNHASRGEIELAETGFREAIDICRQIGFIEGEGLHRGNLAALHYLAGRPAEALRGFEAVLATLEAINNPRSLALMLNNAAFVRHRIVGDDITAADQAGRALEYYKSVDNPRGIAQAASILARITARANPAGGLLLLQEHLEGFVAPGAWTTTHINRARAEICLAAGDLPGARHYCDLAHDAASRGALHDALATIEGLSAQIALAAGDDDRALATARRSTQGLGPGVEQPYLLYYGLFLAATDPPERDIALRAAYQGLQGTLEGFSDAERQMAEAVPEHAAILKEWSVHHAVQRTLDLRRTDGLGTASVTLTMSAPGDHTEVGKPERRRLRIDRMLSEASEQGARLATADIASILGVSTATVRRDLAALRGATS